MLRKALLLLAAAALYSGAATAAPVYFLLGDHPKYPEPPIGLVLNPANDVPGLGPGKTRFSVGDNLGGGGGPLYLTWDDEDADAGASLFGRILNPYDDTFWQVQYDFTGLSLLADGGFTATGGGGTLTRDDDVITLRGKQAGSGLAFFFNNLGFNLPESTGWAGTGWVQIWSAEKQDWMNKGDWVFIGEQLQGPPVGEEVPEPATVSLMLIGLGCLAIRRRRARKA